MGHFIIKSFIAFFFFLLLITYTIMKLEVVLLGKIIESFGYVETKLICTFDKEKSLISVVRYECIHVGSHRPPFPPPG